MAAQLSISSILEQEFTQMNGEQGILKRVERSDLLQLYQFKGEQAILNGTTESDITWRYFTKSGEVEEYSANGRLLFITAANGMRQILSYNSITGKLAEVKDSTGRNYYLTMLIIY